MTKRKRTKRRTILVGTVPYSLAELKRSLDCANAEAQGYLDQLNPLRDENARLRQQLEAHGSVRRIVLELYGVRENK